jgi:hypothetical protein
MKTHPEHIDAEFPGHYDEESFVKAGGEKRIFRVHDLRADRVVALARPLPGATAEQKEQFLREARLTVCLQHRCPGSTKDENRDMGGVFSGARRNNRRGFGLLVADFCPGAGTEKKLFLH